MLNAHKYSRKGTEMTHISPNLQGGCNDRLKTDILVKQRTSSEPGPGVRREYSIRKALNKSGFGLETKDFNGAVQGKEDQSTHSADVVLVNNGSFLTSSLLDANHRHCTGATQQAGIPTSNISPSGQLGKIWFYLFFFLSNVHEAAAMIDVATLLGKTRRLSMSGILGLIETDILFAEPGMSQPEYWRIAQGMLGIGALRVLSKICKMPCFEQLHRIHGVKPPESMQAREFWLRQEAWTELQALNMGQEETSYHRINQGSGPQGKLLWGWKEIEAEKNQWEAGRKDSSNALDEPLSSILSQNPAIKPNGGWGDANTTISVGVHKGEEITQGTTDKWWMDRWQIEALAVASEQKLDLKDACNLLTTAYFGESSGNRHQVISGIICVIFTTVTFLAAYFSNWSWVPQFFALSALGYFTNRTSSLRGWRFVPSPDLVIRTFRPKVIKEWPTKEKVADSSAIRIAIQSSGTAHLKGLILIPSDIREAAIQVAAARRGRYKIDRKFKSEGAVPYHDTKRVDRNWISFEAQSSYYGLLVSVEPDNILRRSLGIVATMVNGLFLMILGFWTTTPEGWGGYILLIYISGIIVAIIGRSRGCVWTLPEFSKVDFTLENVIIIPTMKSRIIGLELERPLKIAGETSKGSAFSTAQLKKRAPGLV